MMEPAHAVIVEGTGVIIENKHSNDVGLPPPNQYVVAGREPIA